MLIETSVTGLKQDVKQEYELDCWALSKVWVCCPFSLPELRCTDFEYRDVTNFLALLAEFAVSNFRQNEQNRLFSVEDPLSNRHLSVER